MGQTLSEPVVEKVRRELRLAHTSACKLGRLSSSVLPPRDPLCASVDGAAPLTGCPALPLPVDLVTGVSCSAAPPHFPFQSFPGRLLSTRTCSRLEC